MFYIRIVNLSVSPVKNTVTSLAGVKESYKLSGKNLTALAEKILYKKTPQEDMYLYLLRPDEKREKALPAIVYFTGGGWVSGNVEGQIPNNLVIHNPVERNKR